MSEEMTREEAIKHIKAMCQMLLGADNKPISDTYYALEMALENLSAEPCEDAISRRAAILAIYNNTNRLNMAKAVRELPSVQPIRPRGHWIEEDGYDGDIYYDCSVCGESWTIIEGTPWNNGMRYFPNCGADMREETNHE